MKAMLHALYVKHPGAFCLVAAIAASWIASVFWYRMRANVWPGVETRNLPTWARCVQALVETASNIVGALRAVFGSGLPPGVDKLPVVGAGAVPASPEKNP